MLFRSLGGGLEIHEYTHMVQWIQFIGKPTAYQVTALLPQWFIEGSARYMEENPEEDNEAATRRLVKKYGILSLQQAIPMIAPDKKTNGWPYYVGMSAIKFIRLTYGKDVFARLHLALARSVDFPSAIQTATGKSFDEVDKAWQKWILK